MANDLEIKVFDWRPPGADEIKGIARLWRMILTDLQNAGLDPIEARQRAQEQFPIAHRLFTLADIQNEADGAAKLKSAMEGQSHDGSNS